VGFDRLGYAAPVAPLVRVARLCPAGLLALIAGCGYDFSGVTFEETSSATPAGSGGSGLPASSTGTDVVASSATGTGAGGASVSVGPGGGTGTGGQAAGGGGVGGGGSTGGGSAGGGGSSTGGGGQGGAGAGSSSSGGGGAGDGGGSTGGGGSTTSGGGDGGGPACRGPDDCPPTAYCCAPTCDDGTCGEGVPALEGTSCGPDMEQFCRDDGACVACRTLFDCGTPHPCHVVACSLSGGCVDSLAQEGASCGLGGVCTIDGQCRECLTGQCGSGTCNVELGECRASHCTNGIPDEDEISLNCGGSCDPCPHGESVCGTNNDCMGYCDEGFCTECTDHTQCDADRWCVEGVCTRRRALGTTCNPSLPDEQCIGVTCNDEGICCNAQCDGPAVSCRAEETAKPTGTCGDVIPTTGLYGTCGP
jgi:hypothetical protein